MSCGHLLTFTIRLHGTCGSCCSWIHTTASVLYRRVCGIHCVKPLMLREMFSYIASPIVGSIAGGLVMSAAIPEPRAFFCLMFALFGAAIATPITLIVGIPSVYLLRRTTRTMLPWLLVIALVVACIVLLSIHCALGSCTAPPPHSFIFSVTTAAVTVFVFIGLTSHESGAGSPSES